MVATPGPVIDSVVRSICGRDVERLAPLTGGGMNETYRADLGGDVAVVVRVARHPTRWFVDEAYLMEQARMVGVPTPEILGLDHVDDDAEVLSFSVQQHLPGRPLGDLVGRLSTADLERCILDAGELMALVHSVEPDLDRGVRHELRWPAERDVDRIARIIAQALDPAAAAVVERGADFLRQEITNRSAVPFVLAQGDFMPGNLLIHDGEIVGVIDWEFAGPAAPAFDVGRWEVSARTPFADRLDLLRAGYARVADPDSSEAGLTPAFAIDWILEMLAWRNPATPDQFRRCIDVIARYTGC
ncbi:phosphotransferase [Nocardioides sp. NPDC006303]|uniref:phosphotransferase family protein n=1 Tax=Nocardioides sp. NPDC006303 TaxID=3156747 RepID=UPI0033A98C7F